ncbi:MAG TPA: hypothetical protein VKA67_01690 [Verrucomicrobiae bacterium]|nr:hypothetical protein [Verrucomicrobiae bacterium]
MNALANGKTINHELQNRQRKSVWNYRVIESVFAPMVFFQAWDFGDNKIRDFNSNAQTKFSG